MTIASLLSILLVTLHLSDDIVRGFEPGGFKNLRGVLTLVIWLYGTLVLGARRSGYVVMLLGSLLGAVVSVAHMKGGRTRGQQDRQLERIYFWVWTQMLLGVTSIFALILSARGLWSLRPGSSSNNPKKV